MATIAEKPKFVWIDDDPERRSFADNMQDSLRIQVDFLNLHNEDLQAKIAELLNGAEPDLIILDHNLHDVKDGSFKAGSTVATVIRETWKRCPIICISGADPVFFDAEQISIYDARFLIDNVAACYSTILSIFGAYQVLRKRNPENVDALLNLLGELDEEMDRLKSVIPLKIKNNLTDPSIWKSIGHWIRHVLINRPGFLYDRLWVATFIGIKENSFSKVQDLFEPAEYKGIFADSSRPRWWKHKILGILSEKVDAFGLPWEKGTRLPGLSTEDQSLCHVTGEPRPETVAFLDDFHSNRAPIKMKETIADESFEDLLYFEEMRKMAPRT